MGEPDAWLAGVVFEVVGFIAAIAAAFVAWSDNRTVAAWSFVVAVFGFVSTKVRIPLLSPAAAIAGPPLFVYAITDGPLWALGAAVVSLVLYVVTTLQITQIAYRVAMSGGIPKSTLGAMTARGTVEQVETTKRIEGE